MSDGEGAADHEAVGIVEPLGERGVGVGLDLVGHDAAHVRHSESFLPIASTASARTLQFSCSSSSTSTLSAFGAALLPQDPHGVDDQVGVGLASDVCRELRPRARVRDARRAVSRPRRGRSARGRRAGPGAAAHRRPRRWRPGP